MPNTVDQSPVGLATAERANIPTERHEYARLATVVEQASDAILITDPGGMILYVNPAFERISGYAQGEVIGREARILRSGKNEPAAYENLWDAISRGKVWKGHLLNERKNGTVYHVEATISPVHDREGRIVNYAAVARDVTQEIELEMRLRQAEKMEAIGQLASGVAHDFNNVLTAILANVGLLRTRLRGEPAACAAITKELEQIEHSARQGASLTRQLLNFSRREAVKLEPLNPRPVLTAGEVMLRRLISKNIAFEMDVAADLHAIQGDVGQLKQILMNLVVNARDAMPGGGRLTVTATNAVLDELYVSGNADACLGPHVLLTVRDTGCGMTAEVLEHLYEPFFTTKPPGKGTGLGLATVYALVRRFGGHITVNSAPDKGTEFKIYFPALVGQLDEAPADAVAESLARGSETILVSEDDEVIRDLECEILTHSGYTVLAAEDGRQALELARANPDGIDLLITDVVMPGIDGPALAAKLAALCPGLKTLFVSGYADGLGMELATQDDHDHFLPKPFTSRGFLQRVREVLDGRQAPCASAAS